MSEQKTHIILRILKFFAWLLLALIVLTVALRFSLKTDFVNDFVKEKGISIANESLNGTLQIENMRGDLWKEITATNITLVQSDTLLSVDTLNVKYDILTILSGTFTVHKAIVAGMNVKIEEEEENQEFNVQNIVKEDTTEADTSDSTFGFEVEEFVLTNSKVSVYSPGYLPDSTITLNGLNAAASFRLKDEISASLSSLTFQLQEGRLPQPIEIKTAGTFEEEEITLQELVIETGRSLFTANARTNLQDSTITAEANTSPLSLADLQPYLENNLPNEVFEITLEASGRLTDLNIKVKVEGNGFDDLLVTSDLSLLEEPTLKKAGISVQNVDLAYFTNDSVDAEIGEFKASFEGNLTSEIEKASLTWGFITNQMRYEVYNVEQLFGSGTLSDGNILAHMQLSDGSEQIAFYPNIQQVFSEMPEWKIPIQVNNLNPAKWAQNPEMQGRVTLSAHATGRGFELSAQPWRFAIQKLPVSGSEIITAKLDGIQVGDQVIQLPEPAKPISADSLTVAGYKFSDVNIRGNINEDSLEVNGGVQLTENLIAFNAEVADFAEEAPSYNFWLSTSGFNASEIQDFKEFHTFINLTAEGSGTYFDLEKMQMAASFKIDSSIINGASFDLLAFEAKLENEFMTITEGELNSQIMEGSFSGRKRISDEIGPEDELTVDLQLLNLQPLAKLFGAEELNADGIVRGEIRKNESGVPEFDGTIDLTNIYYDELFIAENVSGDVRAGLNDVYDFDVELDISAPAISGVTLQDLHIGTSGTAFPDSLDGKFRLDMQSRDAGDITQAGTYSINLNTLKSDLTWNVLDFQTPARLLSLEAPFHLTYQEGTVSTDTLSLISEGSAYVKLAVPMADSVNQEAWIEGQDFNFGVIQEMLFRERFVDGILQGEIKVDRKPDFLAANGAFQISELKYLDTDIDLLDLDFNIAEGRLSADGSIHMQGQKKVYGTINVPFVLADPATLDDKFFEEEVEGKLTIEPLQLTEFTSILEAFNITETEGILSFDGSLSGTAGSPLIDGKLVLEDPTLSGIKIDSAFAEFSYDDIQNNMFVIAEIRAKGQTAASIYSDLPISVDFRTFEVNTPGENDTIKVDLNTTDFNISVFNDFLDPQYLTRLKGVLNADVTMEGTKNNLTPSGFLSLKQAEVTVPIAGIKLQKIVSEINFTKEGLNLKELSITSGKGNFNANGTIALEGIEPTDININGRARQFKLANTNDYNLTIDLNSKLTGSPMRPTASGELTVRNGFIYLQDFGERSVEDVQLDDEEEDTFSPYDSLAIEMLFKIDRNFYVRNTRYLDLEVELTGELDAQKETGGELQLFGTLTGERGYARPLGKNFELDEADFTFSGPLDDPALAIKTSYIPQTSQKEGSPIVLFYIIEGTAQDPEFRFESDPQMEQQDIIAYTLFGRPFYALDSWQQVMSGGGGGSSPTDLLVGVLLDEVEALATRELGIDVVQIDNTRSGSDAVTSIKTGWYLNRRTFFSVVNEISSNPKTLFILEYMLRENLDLIITQGDDNRQGVDIRWQYEY